MTAPAGEYEARLFAALAALPEVDPAVADVARAIEWRRLDEVHQCSTCATARAVQAYVVGPSDLVGARRWLDQCAPCGAALRDWALQGLSDDEILRRYQQWAGSQP